MCKTILITGIAGFIGSNIAKRFISEGFKVIGIDDLSTGKIQNIPDQTNFIEGDILDPKVFNKINEKCSYILHLAGQSSGEISFEDPVKDLHLNTISTLNVINFGIKNQSKKILYASSMSVYGEVNDKPVKETQRPLPISCYGISKLASENYLEIFSKNIPFVSMRMFNVYGPGQNLNNLKQGMVSIFIAQALKNKNICVKGDLNRFRDFIYIDDVVEAWYKATISEKVYNLRINIGTGEKISVKSLLDTIISYIPNSNYFQSGETPGDQHGIYADTHLQKSLLNIEKYISLEKGIELFTENLKLTSNIF